MAGPFYESAGDGYVATELSRGPWDPGAQHAGPVAALLGRELELLPEAEEFELARLTFEILRSVPIGPVAVAARILRPGRRVQLVEAELSVDGEPLVRATAWRIRRAELDLPAEGLPAPEAPPGPEQATEGEFFPTAQKHGYHTAMEVRFLSGGFLELGSARAWLRMRGTLVDAEPPTPLQRLLVAADVGNGISATLDFYRFVFINVELTVHVERPLRGEWAYLDAETRPQPSGVGLSDAILCDRDGRLGRAQQALLIAPR